MDVPNDTGFRALSSLATRVAEDVNLYRLHELMACDLDAFLSSQVAEDRNAQPVRLRGVSREHIVGRAVEMYQVSHDWEGTVVSVALGAVN